MLAAATALAISANAQTILPEWYGYGGNAQHTAMWQIGSATMNQILWQTPVDTNPPYSGNELLIHYGEPAITPLNNVVIPVRHGNSSPFTIEGHSGKDGSLLWSATSSYTQPGYDWIPSVGPTLLMPRFALSADAPIGTSNLSPGIAWPESGGRISIRSNSDGSSGTIKTIAFYGNSNYASNPGEWNSSLKICTPLTCGPDGSIYFGVRSENINPLGIGSCLAVIRPNGLGDYVPVSTMVNDGSIDRVAFNCAPAISLDGKRVYFSVCAGYQGRGYLVALNTNNLLPIVSTKLLDPIAGQWATVTCDGTSSPLMAPDGTVYYGVLEAVLGQNHYRGWLLHFDANLTQSFRPGMFGWDFTPSVFPSKLMTSYHGAATYFLMSKYNNYAGAGGDGVNKIALLDPTTTTIDPANGVVCMGEEATLIGPTPDNAARQAGYPNAVKEWCINSAAVDVRHGYVLAGSEDGWLYKWDPNNSAIKEKIQLTAGLGEAYTPTAVAPNGTIYGINNAKLFAIGQ